MDKIKIMIYIIAAMFFGTLIMAYRIGEYENKHRSKDK
jgi:hypothetical protein